MLGCFDLKCNEVEAGDKPTSDDEPQGLAVEEDNDLVKKPLAIDTSAANAQEQRKGRCPFKQCLSDTFTPCRHRDDVLIKPITTEIRQADKVNEPTSTSTGNCQPDEQVNVEIAPDQRPKSPVITGITTIDDIIHKHNTAKGKPLNNPVITGITTIDALINTLSNDNTKPADKDKVDKNIQILQQLGILHLQDKLTRPRQLQETDEHILREAGAARHLDEDSLSEKEDQKGESLVNKQKELYDKKLGNMSDRQLQILKDAGVVLPTFNVISSPNIRNCATETTAGLTTLQLSESCLTYPTFAPEQEGPNLTYAEKELLRRLKDGWASSGSDCPECGMPIIYKKKVGDGFMECVICGILHDEEEEHEVIQESLSNFDTTISSGMTISNQCGTVGRQGSAISSYAAFFGHPSNQEQYAARIASPTGMSIHKPQSPVASPTGMSIQEPQQVASSTGMSGHGHAEYATLEQCASCQDEVTSEDSTIFGQNHQPHCQSCEKSMIEKVKSDLALQDDDALKKELGKRIFAGWNLLSLNCPCCNLPLISESKGSPSICLRCG